MFRGRHLLGALIGATVAFCAALVSAYLKRTGQFGVGLLVGGWIGLGIGLLGVAMPSRRASGSTSLIDDLIAITVGSAIVGCSIADLPLLRVLPWTVLGLGIGLGVWLCDRSFRGFVLLLAGGMLGGLVGDVLLALVGSAALPIIKTTVVFIPIGAGLGLAAAMIRPVGAVLGMAPAMISEKTEAPKSKALDRGGPSAPEESPRRPAPPAARPPQAQPSWAPDPLRTEAKFPPVSSAPAAAAVPPARPPAPAAPARPPQANPLRERPAILPNQCPSCGRPAPGGYCIICDLMFDPVPAPVPKGVNPNAQSRTTRPAVVGVEEANQVLRREADADPSSGDTVDCTVFAPAEAGPQEEFLVQVFAHAPEKAEEARRLATEFDATAKRGGFTSLLTSVERGSRLVLHLGMRRLGVDATRELVWRGRTESVNFIVEVGEGHPPGKAHGTVTVSQDGVPIGQIIFAVMVLAGDAGATRTSAPTGQAATFDRFFISYATPDRPRVMARVQMLNRLGKSYFQDILHLDPGERWERRLYLEIDRCDAVLLFWSSHAKDSPWVMRECQYTIEKKGIDRLLPVIIEGPPPVTPPPELSELHFNDRLLYLMGE